MRCIMQWLNDNNGALMVLITLVYVIATIGISRSNRLSAEASRKQIEESQKQQKQNVGLQLYAMRKETINKLSQKQYNEVFWDVPLLFSEELSDEFQKVALKAEKIVKLQKSIDVFEAELGVLVGSKASSQIKQIREATSQEDVIQIKQSVTEALSRGRTHADVSNIVDTYTAQVAEAKQLEVERSAETMSLVFKLRDYVKKSIQ